MFNKKIPFYFAILMTIAGIIGTFFLVSFITKRESAPVPYNSINSCTIDLKRLNGYEYIRPLLFTEKACESEKLQNIKYEIDNLVRSKKLSGDIINASIYLRQFNNGEWISIGDQELYNPGSLLKVPELITFMKMNEKTPGLLEKKITYANALALPKQAIYLSKSIEVGKTYTIRELLYYMIAYSDNHATMLLNQVMDLDIFSNVFTDLGITKPDLTKKDIPITARDYSLFMRVLYNASYLSIKDSEYCTELLSHSDFKDGMLAGLPKNMKVAHKFGEAGDGTFSYFSESGIIYNNNSPYLLTIMIKGKNNKVLPALMAQLSEKTFQMISSIN